MIRAATAIALTLALGGCATTDLHEPGCDVEVAFGSYAMGIDTDLATRIRAFLQSDPDIEEVEETHWGREGETTVCVMARNMTSANRVYDDIAAMIPAESPQAPTTVTHRDGRTHGSRMPAGRP